jgi:acyl carrier protein
VAFLAAYQALLARLTGDRSVTVGTVTGGRGRTELEPLIGCFINLLPLRTSLDLTLPFRDAAAQVRSALAAAMANEVPFDELASAVATARDDRMAALFQSTVIWQQAHAERQDWPADVATDRWGRPVDEAAFDLVLIVRELPEDYELCFRYRTDRFAAPVVEQVASLFRQQLESIAAAPDAPLADLHTDADLAGGSAGPAHDLGGDRDVGHRIEAGEIEAVLETHPAVHQAAVVVQGERLVAYVVPAAGISTIPAAVVDHAAALLPSTQVPTAWVAMAALPRTSDGTVDRQGLPDSGPAPRAAPVAARTATEELVAAVLREVLELDVVSMDDDFFAIGGNSLLAMRVMARLLDVTEVELPVRILFTHSTVAELAAAVQDRLLTAGEGTAR